LKLKGRVFSKSHLLGGIARRTSKVNRLGNMFRKNKVLLSVVLLGGLLLVAGLLVFGRSNKQVQAAPGPLEVGVITVKPETVPIYSEWIGTTDGMVNAEIKAQVTGCLKQVLKAHW
jgi:membrane fusion protein (multidrug efflux system)